MFMWCKLARGWSAIADPLICVPTTRAPMITRAFVLTETSSTPLPAPQDSLSAMIDPIFSVEPWIDVKIRALPALITSSMLHSITTTITITTTTTSGSWS